MRNGDYYHFAESAAKLEQAKSYKLAAKEWQIANSYARKEANQKWAEARSHFCERMHKRPFRSE